MSSLKLKIILGIYIPNVWKSDFNISFYSKMYMKVSCQKRFTKKLMRETVGPKEQMIQLIKLYKTPLKYFADSMELSWEKLT